MAATLKQTAIVNKNWNCEESDYPIDSGFITPDRPIYDLFRKPKLSAYF